MKPASANGLQRRRRESFTLIELLIVIVIIAILSGILLRTTVYVNTKMARGRAVRDMQQLRNALAEYHSTFGIFPPVQWVSYEYNVTTPNLVYTGSLHCATGLCYYLCGTKASWDGETPRWKNFLEDIPVPQIGSIPYSNRTAGGWVYWTNNVASASDPWGTEYQYICVDPYQTYVLRSAGPDRTFGTADDIGGEWAQ